MKKFIKRLKANVLYRKIIANSKFERKIMVMRSHVKIDSRGRGRISLFSHAEGNEIHIGKGTLHGKIEVTFQGRNNKLIIGDNCRIGGGCRFIFTCNNQCITIGNNCTIEFKSDLICHEDGSSITIGDDLMASIYVIIRNGDGHGIFDKKGNRLNPGGDIVIGNHVWIAEGARIMKGVTIEDGAVVGCRALVTKSVKSRSIVAGIPAKEVRRDVYWSRNYFVPDEINTRIE